MGFAYIEPTIEELNRRISGGEVFIQSDLSGTYREYYAPVLPEELTLAAQQPTVTMDMWNTWAGIQTQEAYSAPAPFVPTPSTIPTTSRTGAYDPGPGTQSGQSDLLTLGLVALLGIGLSGSRTRARTRAPVRRSPRKRITRKRITRARTRTRRSPRARTRTRVKTRVKRG